MGTGGEAQGIILGPNLFRVSEMIILNRDNTKKRYFRFSAEKGRGLDPNDSSPSCAPG